MSSAQEEIVQLSSDSRFRVFQYFYDANDNLEYICRNKSGSATVNDSDWEIFKLTWAANLAADGYNITQKEGPRGGSVAYRSAPASWR